MYLQRESIRLKLNCKLERLGAKVTFKLQHVQALLLGPEQTERSSLVQYYATDIKPSSQQWKGAHDRANMRSNEVYRLCTPREVAKQADLSLKSTANRHLHFLYYKNHKTLNRVSLKCTTNTKVLSLMYKYFYEWTQLLHRSKKLFSLH